MQINQVINTPTLFARALSAYWYAGRHHIPGLEFASFGRRLGLRMLMRRARPWASYLLTPVNITRYYEFPFTFASLSSKPRQCLDVSSPRLFSFYVADKHPDATIRMINPDSTDCAFTHSVVTTLNFQNIRIDNLDLRAALADGKTYDHIWSISVIEHIDGDYDDRAAARELYDALCPGGRLILTLPVDRILWNEYRSHNAYGTQSTRDADRYFFQRYYDRDAIHARIIDEIGRQPSVVSWFGEKVAGHFEAYEQQWIEEGYNRIVDDPKEIADYYQAYPSWDAMPGKGVCGMMFEKPT
jgi:predicted SAM-dependent methyltransferase